MATKIRLKTLEKPVSTSKPTTDTLVDVNETPVVDLTGLQNVFLITPGDKPPNEGQMTSQVVYKPQQATVDTTISHNIQSTAEEMLGNLGSLHSHG